MAEQLTVFKNGLKRNLNLVCDLIILNLLFVLCSIPVITLGAAGAACYTYVIRILRGEQIGISIAGFFKEFKACFKKATAGWLLELVCLALAVGDIWYAVFYSEPDNTFFLVVGGVIAVGILFSGVWFYPLVARYENKLSAYIKNSFLMMFAQLPNTLLAFLLQAAFIAVPVLFFDAFVYLGWFWLLFGASLPIYWTAKILRKHLQCEPRKELIED